MAYETLQDYLKALDARAELRRISTPVDPVLEATELADRAVKSGGPALLFEHPVGSTTTLAKELNAAGYLTKSWTTKEGILRAGGPWNKAHIYRLLNNPLYIGEVSHKGERYPGEQEAIVPRGLT